jgi:hypothetical protein
VWAIVKEEKVRWWRESGEAQEEEEGLIDAFPRMIDYCRHGFSALF